MKCPKCGFENLPNSCFCNKCGTKFHSLEISSSTETILAQIDELAIGSTFAGRYTVIEELGRGGMGKIYKVLDKEINEKVALKLLKSEIAADSQTIDRFRNELKFARRISHKNVCRMYDLSKEGVTYFFTMEYVPGEDLRSTMKRAGPLSAGNALFIAKQICEGLAAAHQLGVIHRDLKPQNIMIDREGNVRIMDFGIARSTQAKDITHSGMMIGTPIYMSPEQAAAEKTDSRSDIYSIGIILFEMVTGRLPFEGDTPLGIALKHKTELPPDPRDFNAQIPEVLSTTILKCLKKNKEERYQSANELLAELNNIESAIPTTDRFLPKRTTPLKTLKRLFRPLPVLGTLLLIALIIGGYFYFRGPQPIKEKEKAKVLPAIPSQPVQKAEVLASKYGNLEINSVPQGAEVYINNKREGITPFNRELSPGGYQIKLRKYPDYKEITDVLSVSSGAISSKNYNLSPAYFLKIETMPEEADVRIDGNYKGKTPIQIELSWDTCRLKIEKGGDWLSIDEELVLKPGLNLIKRSLNRRTYSLSIETNPPGARVFIRGKKVGTSPLKILDLFGDCNIKIEKDGYKTVEDSIMINNDIESRYELIKVEVILGKIRLTALPFADVFIDGKPIGEVPPIKNQEVEEGKHTIEFISAKINKKHTVEVEIKAGENIEIRMNMGTGAYKIVKID